MVFIFGYVPIFRFDIIIAKSVSTAVPMSLSTHVYAHIYTQVYAQVSISLPKRAQCCVEMCFRVSPQSSPVHLYLFHSLPDMFIDSLCSETSFDRFDAIWLVHE